MPRGISWDYQIYCECDYSPAHSSARTYLIGRQQSGLLWIGWSEDDCWPPVNKVSGSMSYPSVSDFIKGLPESSPEELREYFEKKPKYRDVAMMMKWQDKDIKVIINRSKPQGLRLATQKNYNRLNGDTTQSGRGSCPRTSSGVRISWLGPSEWRKSFEGKENE